MLTSFEITNFRAFSHLRIERLGRVNLIVGKNNVGKTTLLEALRFYAMGSATPLRELLVEHDEVFLEGALREPLLDLCALFHGRPSDVGEIKIGPLKPEKRCLTIQLIDLERIETWEGYRYEELEADDRTSEENLRTEMEGELHKGLSIGRKDRRIVVHPGPTRRSVFGGTYLGPAYIGPRGVAQPDLTFWWDKIVLTASEDRVTQNLSLVAPVERITAVEDPLSRVDGQFPGRSGGRIFKVRLNSQAKPVSLKSLGDGAVRIFQLATAIEYARQVSQEPEPSPSPLDSSPDEPWQTNDLLLVDEIENGIHHTVHAELWRNVFRLARQHELQVFATSHSLDCLRGFAEAARDEEADDGLVIRLEKIKSQEQTGAVIIDQDDLPIVVRDSIEVR